jgi:hypothetical protein
MERQPQRHLITTHLHAIAQRTGLEPGQVNTQDPALIREPWKPGYWLDYDYVLTGNNYNQPLEWMWSLSTIRVPADYRREQPWTDKREIPAELAQEILSLVHR